MSYITLERDKLVYEAEYFLDDGMVTVIGERGISNIDINGMSECVAARTGLRNLINQGLIEPKS